MHSVSSRIARNVFGRTISHFRSNLSFFNWTPKASIYRSIGGYISTVSLHYTKAAAALYFCDAINDILQRYANMRSTICSHQTEFSENLVSSLALAQTAFRQQVQSTRQCFDDQLRTVLADVLLLMGVPQSGISSAGSGLAGANYDIHIRALGLGLREGSAGEVPKQDVHFPKCPQASLYK